MANDSRKINIFDYLDYRLFLKTWYEGKKKHGEISLRTFSAKAGFTSPNYFKLIVDGQRNLSEDGIKRFTLALELNKQESEFFRCLAHFNQAATHDEKNRHYQKLLRSRRYRELKPIKKAQYRFYSEWYHPVVRELVVLPEYRDNPQALAARIYPHVSVLQVEKSVRLLETLGFIARAEDGSWRQATPVMATEDESDAVVLLNYHREILDMAKQVLDEVPQDKRDISAMTLGIAAERLPEIKKKIQEFRRDILNLVAADDRPEKVVLLSVQLMPLTQEDKTC
jgi:uncharacterized protein (TIGR02147 family)